MFISFNLIIFKFDYLIFSLKDISLINNGKPELLILELMDGFYVKEGIAKVHPLTTKLVDAPVPINCEVSNPYSFFSL